MAISFCLFGGKTYHYSSVKPVWSAIGKGSNMFWVPSKGGFTSEAAGFTMDAQ